MRDQKNTTASRMDVLASGRRGLYVGQDRRYVQRAVLTAGLALAGCAADDGSTGKHEDQPAELASVDSAGESTGLNEIDEALNDSVQSNARTYSWSKNQPDVVLAPRDTHVCFLTEISGEMGRHAVTSVHRSTEDIHPYTQGNSGSGSFWVDTIRDDDGQNWKLGGYSEESNSLHSEATCVPLANFALDDGMVAWVSRYFSASRDSPTDMWKGDAASYVAGVVGELNGGGERAEVVYGTGSTLSQLLVETGPYAYLFATGYSLFVGVPSSGQQFYPNVMYANDNSEVKLMRTTQGACFLTKISGEFLGSEERIRIFPKMIGNEEWWMLEAHAGRGSAYGGAGCIDYVRNPIPF